MKKNLIVSSLLGYHRNFVPKALLLNISDEMDDVETVAGDLVSVGIQDDVPFIILPDGTRLDKGDADMPDWAIFHGGHSRLAACFETMGITCFSSSETAMLAKDKVRSSMLFSKAFPSPDSLFYRGRLDIEEVAEVPFMLKGNLGHQGDSVWKIDDPALVGAYEKRHATMDNVLICQELMPSADDVRVYMLGREIALAVTRRVDKGVWKSNLSSSPIQELYELDDAQREMISRGAELLPDKSGLTTFDFLFDEDGGLVFCEMNTAPGTNALRNLGREEKLIRAYIAYARENA